MTVASTFASSTPNQGSHAWFDISAGVAGDMLLATLLDAGAPIDGVQAAIDAVLPGAVRLVSSTVTRAGLRATKLDVEILDEGQPYRHWQKIESLIEGADLTEDARRPALAAFARLAEAESRVHGIPESDVHFHEVGACDAIADVVGVSAALTLLGVSSISAGPVALGSGRASTAHGDLPVPVPAVLELAKGWQVEAGGKGELATPTGMAMVRALATTCQAMPPLEVSGIGVGAGSKDLLGRANVARVVLGSEPAARSGDRAAEHLRLLEANIDDLDPRVWPDVLSTLIDAGAADAWLIPILMKKGRPAHTLSVLCTPENRDRLRELAFSLTSTFGIREYAVDRVALQRDWRPVEVRGHTIRVKLSVGADGRVRHATPEFEDAVAAARNAGLPLRQVLAEANAAAEAAGLTRQE
jgi:pyridinium-3,5-bisthiocarboxylic acid mononucleotide nickel chelatase